MQRDVEESREGTREREFSNVERRERIAYYREER